MKGEIMNWKRIIENAIAIFFAFIPMMVIMGFLWFLLMIDTEYAGDYLAQYQETVVRVDSKIHGIKEYDLELANRIEVLETQVNQLPGEWLREPPKRRRR